MPFRNGHLIPYSEYLLDDGGDQTLPRERILRFDHLEEDFRRLCSDRRLPIEPLASLNTSEMARFQVEDLDEEVVHALRCAYEKDYALFESLR